MRFTGNEISELIVAVLLGGSVLVAVLTAALRFGVRPLLEDWAKLRAQSGPLERRLAEVEDEVRRLKAASEPRLPAETIRRSDAPRV
jgi:hypothetical protein